MQNIVTNTEEDAKKLIEHLRKNNLGRASFLPITSVKGKKLDKINKTNITGVIGFACDLVKTNKKYEEIINNLLGKTVITEDMTSAIALAKQNNYSFRIVTIKGDIITPSGSITGGSIENKTANILGRTTQIEDLKKDIIKLNKKIEEINKEKEEIEKEIKPIQKEKELLEKNLQEIEITYATEKQKVVSLEENIEKTQKKLNTLKKELELIDENKKENLLNQKIFEEQIQKIDKENDELNMYINEFIKNNKDNQEYIDDLNFDITNLKISVSSFDESEMSIKEIIERIDQEIINTNNSIKNKAEQREKFGEDNKILEENIKLLEEKIENIKENVSNSGKKVEELKNERTLKSEELIISENQIEQELIKINDINNQIAKLDIKKSKIEVELEQIINKMWEDYEVTPNNIENYKKPENIQATTKQVKILREEIKELGSVNIDAIEEYKQTKERYDFMCEQRLDLENSSIKLKKIIQDMTKIMKEQFIEKFKVINQNFREVFMELFDGGKAELKLADEEKILECGIEIEVQPPGKKLQNMNLLSGGEKAFTAIALLFAILKINPAPFCVLDEIEAALDEVNVYRFAQYLKKFTKDTQFLVITHRKGTMEIADTVYGITMKENGISKLLSMKLS